MSCKLAIQIFDNSVSAAIKTCLQTGELKSKTAKDTADFLLEINNIIINTPQLVKPINIWPYRLPRRNWK